MFVHRRLRRRRGGCELFLIDRRGVGRLPDAGGLFRFRDTADAVWALETVLADYPTQSALARRVAEEYFDGRKVAGEILEAML